MADLTRKFLSSLKRSGNIIELDVAKWDRAQSKIRKAMVAQNGSDGTVIETGRFSKYANEVCQNNKIVLNGRKLYSSGIREVRIENANFFCQFHLESSFLGFKISIENCDFYGGINCNNTIFQKTAKFNRSKFHSDALFCSAIFLDQAHFFCSTFAKEALFYSTTFIGSARFYASSFKRTVTFRNVRGFLKDFPLDIYPKSFYPKKYGARFLGDSRFQSIDCAGLANFVTTEFQFVPSFHGSKFGVVPLIQNVSLPITIAEMSKIESYRHRFLVELLDSIPSRYRKIIDLPTVSGISAAEYQTITVEGPERFRTLKTLADQYGNHQQKLDFRAGEIIANRFHFRNNGEKTNLLDVSATHYWLGKIYGVLSDYGRSFLRPIVFLSIALMAATFGTYIISEVVTGEGECLLGATKSESSLILTLHKMIPFYGVSESEDLSLYRKCVFGVNFTPLWFHALGVFAMLVALPLIFLIGFGLRNILK